MLCGECQRTTKHSRGRASSFKVNWGVPISRRQGPEVHTKTAHSIHTPRPRGVQLLPPGHESSVFFSLSHSGTFGLHSENNVLSGSSRGAVESSVGQQSRNPGFKTAKSWVRHSKV
ncbi:hypothetical protein BaRGS_00007661 [Batillaria attramentaria]|uniref:Ribosomal protein L2 n=1 Tax=Batillaria attramentaria TaxID=370345 RepID=A0ABD0LNZ2_9CAEN